MTSTELTEEQIEKWAVAVVPYIRFHLDQGVPESEAIDQGLLDYAEFVEEMAVGATERSQKVVKVLSATVFSEINLSTTLDD